MHLFYWQAFVYHSKIIKQFFALLTYQNRHLFGSVMDRGGGVNLAPPAISTLGHLIIGAKHNFCDNFPEDYFEVCNISVAQNLTVLDAILHFC